MRSLYERQLAEKNTEIGLLKDKIKDLQKKNEMLGLELAGLKDANDKNNSDKLREMEKLKQTI
jgi:regulator of replication initiation timing